MFNNTQSTASGSLQSTRLGLRGSIPTQGLSWRATRAGQRAAGAQAAAPAWALAVPSRWRGSSWAFQLRTGLLLWPRRTVAGRRPADTYSLIYRHRFVVHSCCLQDPADFTHVWIIQNIAYFNHSTERPDQCSRQHTDKPCSICSESHCLFFISILLLSWILCQHLLILSSLDYDGQRMHVS